MMKKRCRMLCSVLLLAALLLSLTGCGSAAAPGGAGTPSGQSVRTGKTVDLMRNVSAVSAEGKTADTAFRDAYLAFTAALLKETYAGTTENRSVLLSPLSVMTALAMTANGAKGETLAEMEQVLTRGEKSADGATFGLEALNGYLHQYYKDLPSSDKFRFSFANSIWFKERDQGFKAEEAFLQKNKAVYGAEAFQAPFEAQTVRDINDWIDQKTDHMIPKILAEIDPLAVMYLINALLFDAEWETAFGTNRTKTSTFHALTGAEQRVPMMSNDESLLILSSDTLGIMKPYADDRYRFAAFLPLDETADFSQYMNGLTAEKIGSLLENVTRKDVVLTMPAFTTEYFSDLAGVLRRMGITHAFDDADFSGISRSDSLAIGRVLHKARLELDNAGTKAAAVTVVEMTRAAVPVPGDISAVRLDRPFVYMIIDTEQMLPIFIGTLTEIPQG